MTHVLGEKALDCLIFISLNGSDDVDEFTFSHAAWEKRYALLCEKWSEKAVWRKLDELADRGYIDYGVSPRMGWLSDKGIEKLKEFVRS